MLSRIGKYTVEKELGHGGFGRVYLAFDPDVKRKVAIKRIENVDPAKLKYFLMEIPTTGRLAHKNIVTIYDSGEDAGNPYLVMELLEGQTLNEVIRDRKPLSLIDKIRIMMQVAEGLGYAHSKGVVHRDVKPENIMLLADNTVKIMDFGIALAPDRNVHMTQTGGLIGTPRYFAPEQIEGQKATGQTDIFAYGDVFYELLTGKHPFQRYINDWMGLQGAILTYDPPPVGQLLPGCPEALELLVQRTLAKDPQFRYQTFSELILDGEAILVDLQHDLSLQILEEAHRLIDAGDLRGARAKVLESQRLDPGNRDARRLLDTVNQQIEKEELLARVAGFLTQAEGHMRERRFHEAVQVLETAARVGSSAEIVQTRLAEARDRLDKSLRANRLVEEARSWQQKGELAEALDRLRTALEIDPDHTEARRLTPRLREQLERRLREQRRQEALQAASSHAAAKRYADAVRALDELEREQPGAAGVAEIRSEIGRQQAEDERRQRAARFNLAVSRTREALEAGELERAGQMLDHLDANFASEPGAAEVLPGLREQWKSLVRGREIDGWRRRAGNLLNQKSFPEALSLLADALRRFPDDPGLARLNQSAAEMYEQHRRSEAITVVLKESNLLRETGHLPRALEALAGGRKRWGDEAAFLELSRQIESEIERQRYAAGLEELLKTARSLVNLGHNSRAVDLLSTAREYAGEPEVCALLESASAADEQRIVSAALAAAEDLKSRGDAKQALAALVDAQARYPHNAALWQTADRLREQIDRGRRQTLIAINRNLIRVEIKEGEWKRAETALRRARSEFPGETVFNDLAEQVESGLFELQSRQMRPPEIDAIAERIRDLLTRDAVRQAASELDAGRTRYPNETIWATLEGELEAREKRQAEVAAIAERVRGAIGREDLSQAAAELSAGRAKYADELLWARLRAEIGAREAVPQRQDDVVASAQKIRECLKRGDVLKAASELAAGQVKYPGESLWLTLQSEIDARETRIKRKTSVAAIAQRVRECLSRNDLLKAAGELAAGQVQYPDESLWPTLQAEIDARSATLKRQGGITQRIRDYLDRH